MGGCNYALEGMLSISVVMFVFMYVRVCESSMYFLCALENMMCSFGCICFAIYSPLMHSYVYIKIFMYLFGDMCVYIYIRVSLYTYECICMYIHVQI